MVAKKGGLGRGLDALFGDAPVAAPVSTKEEIPKQEDLPEKVKYITIHNIKPNKNQPRKVFSEEKIDELAGSIKEHGIIQPIVVRKKGANYEIVAGERRYRAAIRAGLTEVPCLIRELTDNENMLLAIIENMQREDLNPVEEAEGLNQMISTFRMTQEQVSRSVGKSRPYIANALRLLKLPEYIREAISDGRISAAHGRTLVTVEDETQRKHILDRIITEGLSVRDTERLAAKKAKVKRPVKAKPKDADLSRVEGELKDALGTRVKIVQAGKKGKIEIEYYSKDELERLIELLKSLG